MEHKVLMDDMVLKLSIKRKELDSLGMKAEI